MGSVSFWAFVGVVMVTITRVSARLCEDVCKNNSGDLSFCHMGDADSVRKGTAKMILCCAHGFTGDIMWYKLNSSQQMGKFPSRDSDGYIYQHHKQMMTIRAAKLTDRGTFRCVASNITHSVSFDYHLNVLRCELPVPEPKVRDKPGPTVYTSIGETVTLNCSGDFSCTDPIMKIYRSVKWFRYGRTLPLEEGDHETYSITDYTDERDKNVLGKRFTLKCVTSSNLSSTYFCQISVFNIFTNINVTLVQNPVEDVPPLWAKLSLGAIVLVAVLMIICWVLWKDRIIFLCRTLLHMFPRLRVGAEYHLCLIYSSKDMEEAETIKNKLEKLEYKVYFHDTETAAEEVDAVGQLKGLDLSSHCLIFLSADGDDEHFHKYFVDTALNMLLPLIVVYKGAWEKCVQKIKSTDTRERLQIVKRLKWPNDDSSTNSRKQDNFWCSLRSSLPPPGQLQQHSDKCMAGSDETKTVRPASDSSQPLLLEERSEN